MYRRRRWAHRVTDDAHTPPAPPINAIADAFVEEYEALDPVPAAEYGIPRHEHGSPTCPPTASPPARCPARGGIVLETGRMLRDAMSSNLVQPAP